MAGHDHDFDSPVDLAPRLICGGTLGWTSAIMAVACAVLFLGNAISLREWVEEQTPGPIQQKAADIAAGWEKATDVIGLSKPRATLHAGWKAAQAVRFGGGKAADEEGDETSR